MSSPSSSNKENEDYEEDGPIIRMSPHHPQIEKYTATSIVNKEELKTKRYRHFGIPPDVNSEKEIRGPPVKFILFAWLKYENDIPMNVLQCHIATSVRISYSNGLILRSKEKSATYPVIYFSRNVTVDINYTIPHIKGCSPQEGVYEEVRSIKSVGDVKYNVSPQKWKHYIVLGFKTMPVCFGQTLTETWKDWTAARYIYINVPEEMGLSQIILYKRTDIYSTVVSGFTYLVIAECCTVNTEEKRVALLDFIQRLRVERVSGYVSLYEIDSEF